MPFLILNNIKINFINQNFNWRLYTTTEAFLTIKQIELIQKKSLQL